MKKLKVIIIAVSLVVILVCGGAFAIFAINAADTDIGNNEVEETLSSEAAFELAEKDKKFLEKYNNNNQNDLKALEILRSRNKTDATELIQDKDKDCELMSEICDMLKNNSFSADEKEIMERYLLRRLTALDGYYSETHEGSDILLIDKIEEVLDYENYDKEVIWNLFS